MTDIREQIERLRNEGWYACNELEADAVADAMEKLLERNDILEENDIECTNEIMRLTKRNELLEADKRRMDYLESEAIREIDLQAPRSLFRRNVPIMRAAIDEALAAVQEKDDG